MRRALLAAVALVIAGPAVAQAKLEPSQKAALAAIRDEFDRELLDYTAARFREARFTFYNPITVCGLVNSKNRSGAYGRRRTRLFARPAICGVEHRGRDHQGQRADAGDL